ncbi:hypothetical protein EYF80_030767 [Liparis tanakae]|uniref:Uncharacterized protein n=1 Tax=Liparis tanakae TaxID=230148 RepID=A0A4Z2GZV4_9TELE|nr:hypothetical protein EYF80_030767 [Liparis tanakae]
MSPSANREPNRESTPCSGTSLTISHKSCERRRVLHHHSPSVGRPDTGPPPQLQVGGGRGSVDRGAGLKTRPGTRPGS